MARRAARASRLRGLQCGLLSLFVGHLTFAQVKPQTVDVTSSDRAVSASNEGEAERLAAKDALLQASEQQRLEVSKQIDALVRWNPSAEPAKKLGGEWTLIYTDAPDILSIPTSPFASIGRIGQEIDSEQGVIANVIEYRPSTFATGLKESASEDLLVQRVFTDYVVESASSVELKIRGLGIHPSRILGFEVPEVWNVNLKGPQGGPADLALWPIRDPLLG
ncbi:unnamed protein product [Durusdinium trenchii]|uniref:Plastid lipid-associated protein/fibrillin conserved domain-containing protein n=1 Tax=Durusdinium trenchii TaxID=1381693 RepID=A0ABP0PX52_9DINO